jgi:hypothetical protein
LIPNLGGFLGFYGCVYGLIDGLSSLWLLVMAILVPALISAPVLKVFNPVFSFSAIATAAPTIAPTPTTAPEITDRQALPSTTLSADDIPTEKLTQFVTAYAEVMKLIRRNEGLIQTAETEQESIRLQQAIETSAAALIETAGLTRSEYIQLLGLANLDDEFGEKIVTLLQEKS